MHVVTAGRQHITTAHATHAKVVSRYTIACVWRRQYCLTQLRCPRHAILFRNGPPGYVMRTL